MTAQEIEEAKKRNPAIRLHLDPEELVVDNFAGGGGASTGIFLATGRDPDLAINHDAEALAMHEANHPKTRHLREDVFKIDPVEVCGGKRVGLAWFSPDCTHFSKAKGGKPVSRKRRGLAWVVVRWATLVKPRVIALENVEEFTTWGPLGKDMRPDKTRAGKTFRAWVAKLRKLGYVVEWRELTACDYGAPTKRKRLFIVARCDGQPIVWPTPTHGRGRKPYRAAAECIDFSLPCPSIFTRKKPLAEATLRRVARGLRKFVIESSQPFVIPLTHSGGPNRAYGVDAPLPTITCAHRGEFALVAPTLIQTGYGEREGQAPRCLDIHQPLGTVVAGGPKHALVAAFLAKHYGGHETPGSHPCLPMDTITTQDHHALVVSHLTKFQQNSIGQDLREPIDTVMAGAARFAEVRAFLVAYFGNEKDGADLFSPMRTVTTKDRYALVTIHGVDYVIADIGMRMLTPRELFNAQGFPRDYKIALRIRKLVASKRIAGGRWVEYALGKTAQTRMVGNSASPQNVAAVVRSQFGEHEQMQEAFA